MNSAIERIKKSAFARPSKEKVILDTDADEDQVALLLEPYGTEWETTRAKRGRYCRWDIDGKTRDNKVAKMEIKSRTYGHGFDTWIIDTYKIDYMLKHFPKDRNYFVNIFEGEYKVFCAKHVAKCEKVSKFARFADGKSGMREYYVIPKNEFIVELATGQKGDKFNNSKIWRKKKHEK